MQESSKETSKADKSEANDEADSVEETAYICKPEHLEKLAANLTKIADWKKVIPKLGLTEDLIQKMFDEQKLSTPQGQFLPPNCCPHKFNL